MSEDFLSFHLVFRCFGNRMSETFEWNILQPNSIFQTWLLPSLGSYKGNQVEHEYAKVSSGSLLGIVEVGLRCSASELSSWFFTVHFVFMPCGNMREQCRQQRIAQHLCANMNTISKVTLWLLSNLFGPRRVPWSSHPWRFGSFNCDSSIDNFFVIFSKSEAVGYN